MYIPSFIKYNFLSFTWAITILIACVLPSKDLPHFIETLWDKAIHLLIYMLLSLFTYYGWAKQTYFISLHRHTLLKVILATTSYGFFVEICQHVFTKYRYFDIEDALANAIGAVLGCLLHIVIRPWFNKKKQTYSAPKLKRRNTTLGKHI